MTTRTRFAPSPTGYLHVGGARTALFCWLHARARAGQFILRIEDTDRERSTQESVDAILDGMRWLELDWDEGPFYQSQRMQRYDEVIEQLLADDRAYHCDCSRERLEALREEQMAKGVKPRYDGHCRQRQLSHRAGHTVVRFRNPSSGEVVFKDQVRGVISISNDELDDLVISRPDGSPTYNFCVVVDDLDMGVTEVIRGDDHINNTPRQINIYYALGAEPPAFAHVPMILGDDGARLSKRHGAVSVLQYRDDGYLPQALLNYLVRLGWSSGDQEVFSREEMVAGFDITAVNRKAAAFNTDKLNWLNQHYMKTLPATEVAPHLRWHFDQLGIDPDHGPELTDLIPIQADRAVTLREMAEDSRYYYQDLKGYDAGDAHKHLKGRSGEVFALLEERLGLLPQWQQEALQAEVKAAAAELELGMGKVAQPLRVALVGQARSPSIEKTLWLVGRERCLERLRHARAWMAAQAES
ncbi:MAG: glutamate--tRNA ligase [Wenzhouxiangellaceae bacterium]